MKNKCIDCGKILWSGELCEECLLEHMGRGLRKQLKEYGREEGF